MRLQLGQRALLRREQVEEPVVQARLPRSVRPQRTVLCCAPEEFVTLPLTLTRSCTLNAHYSAVRLKDK